MRVRYTSAAGVSSETAPLASATLQLFDSFVAFNGVPCDVHELVRHTVLLVNDQIGTLRLKASDDGVSASYKVVDSVAVAIPVGPLETVGPVDFAIDGLKFYRIDFINGGTNQGAGWKVQQEITEKVRGAQT